MNEYEMACEVRKHIGQFVKIIDGVYVFNMGGKFGTVKNYQQDEEHWEVMFDNLTHEQVIELFEGVGTCKYEFNDGHWTCSECGYITGVSMSGYHYCPHCGLRIEVAA